MTPGEYSIFREAFSTHVAHQRFQCACGRVFFDRATPHIVWAPGEFAALQQHAIAIGGPIAAVQFEGRTFAACCICWHDHADQIVRLFDGCAGELGVHLDGRCEDGIRRIGLYSHGRQFRAYLSLAEGAKGIPGVPDRGEITNPTFIGAMF